MCMDVWKCVFLCICVRGGHVFYREHMKWGGKKGKVCKLEQIKRTKTKNNNNKQRKNI